MSLVVLFTIGKKKKSVPDIPSSQLFIHSIYHQRTYFLFSIQLFINKFPVVDAKHGHKFFVSSINGQDPCLHLLKLGLVIWLVLTYRMLVNRTQAELWKGLAHWGFLSLSLAAGMPSCNYGKRPKPACSMMTRYTWPAALIIQASSWHQPPGTWMKPS